MPVRTLVKGSACWSKTTISPFLKNIFKTLNEVNGNIWTHVAPWSQFRAKWGHKHPSLTYVRAQSAKAYIKKYTLSLMTWIRTSASQLGTERMQVNIWEPDWDRRCSAPCLCWHREAAISPLRPFTLLYLLNKRLLCFCVFHISPHLSDPSGDLGFIW